MWGERWFGGRKLLSREEETENFVYLLHCDIFSGSRSVVLVV